MVIQRQTVGPHDTLIHFLLQFISGQAFHICGDDGNDGLLKYSFLCPNGTLFNQEYFVCDWWFNVDCSTTEDFYGLNEEVAIAAANANQERIGRSDERDEIIDVTDIRNGNGRDSFRRNALGKK